MKRKIMVLTIVCLLLLSHNDYFIQRGYCSYPVEADYYEEAEEPDEEPDEDEEERKEREELEEAINESSDSEADYPYY